MSSANLACNCSSVMPFTSSAITWPSGVGLVHPGTFLGSGLSTFEAPGGLLFDTGEVVSELPNVSGAFELERLRDVTRFVLFTGAAAFALLSCLSARARTLAPRVVSLRDLCFAESGTPPLADEAIAIRGDQTRWTVISLRSGCQLLSQIMRRSCDCSELVESGYSRFFVRYSRFFVSCFS